MTSLYNLFVLLVLSLHFILIDLFVEFNYIYLGKMGQRLKLQRKVLRKMV